MSPEVRFTDAARWQWRAAIERLRGTRPGVAREALSQAASFLRDPGKLQAVGRPLAEFPQLSHREIRLDRVRLFFRSDGTTLWIVGVWKS